MKPDMVVDIGNSRIKWARCGPESVVDMIDMEALSPEFCLPPLWGPNGPLAYVVAGVHPQRTAALAGQLQQQGNPVQIIDSARQLNLKVAVLHPDRVGIDRLLNAVAACHRIQSFVSRIIIDAGSAVTVDWVDGDGAFRGGSIFPGFRLMAKALNDYTALLPLVDPPSRNPPLPGTTTTDAIEAGLFWAVAGGIKALVRQLKGCSHDARHCVVFLTGGDAAVLAPVMDSDVIVWPEMTLEGIRLAAEALP